MINTAFAAGVNTVFGNASTLAEYVKLIYNWMLGTGISVAILLIIYSGFIIATSGGNPDAIATAKRDLAITISGIVLLFAIKIVIDIIWQPF